MSKYSSLILRLLSVAADIVTLLSLLAAGILALNGRYENVLALRVGLFISYIFRVALIVLFLTVLYGLTNLVYLLILMIFGYDVSYGGVGYFWDSENWFSYVIAYLIAYGLSLAIAWVGIGVIWTFSWNHAKQFMNLFIPNTFAIGRRPALQIISATYGTHGGQVDVTRIAQDMVTEGRLTITASNNLAGDPDVGTLKQLSIIYRVGQQTFRRTISENETLTIP